MAIYRGPGGSGDATTDSSTQATAAINAAADALTSKNAAAASATAAANSATSASNSASTATTQATNSSNSATSAGTYASNASSSASSASTSASTATTQAGIATTKASEASTSASNAATSATNAASSASNASSSATSAANAQSAAETARDQTLAAFDSFDDRYLGQKSTAPTVDNDGNTLVAGALYFNTTTNEMKVWDGSQWLNAYASLSGALLATNNLSDLNNKPTARTNLGVAIGTDVQAYDADLGAIAALTGTTGLLKKTAANTWSLDTTAYTTNLGTVTSVAAITLTTTGTDLSSSVATGTTTPVITLNVPTASDTNRGVLSSTDWSTFNGKQSALVSGTNIKTVNSTSLLGSGDVSVGVTSVTGTAPVVSSGGATPAISIAAATTSVNGYLTSTDWNTFNNKVSSRWSLTGSNIYYSAGSVGVNTSSIAANCKLAVNGNPPTAGAISSVATSTGGYSLALSDNVNSSLYVSHPVGALSTISTDGSGSIAFATNGTTEAMRIDNSQKVGIGTSSPTYKVDIQGNTAGQFWASIKNTNAGASSIGGWFFGNDTYSDVGGVFAGSSGGGGFGGANSMNIGSWKAAPLAMFTNNTERMRIDSSGNVKLTTAGTVIQNSSGRPILNQTGSVLQVVTYTTNTNFATNSSTPTDTQLTLSITLSSTSSKVLVMVHHADAGKAQLAINGSVRLVRDGTVVFNPTYTIGRDDTPTTNFSGGFDFHYLDSPATSGVVTYKTQAWTAENTTRFYLGLLSAQHSITLMEIAG